MKKGSLSAGFPKMLLERKSDVFFCYIFIIGLMVVTTAMNNTFLTPGNILNIISIWVPMTLVAYAQTFIIISGGLDLSAGSVVSLSTVFCAAFMTQLGVVGAIVISLALGAGVGLLNGLIITKGGQQPMIVTFATQTIFAGVALLILSRPGGSINSDFARFIMYGMNKMTLLVFLIIATVVLWLLLNKTTFGRHVFAVGGNENSAVSAGINVERTKIIVYVLGGLISALGGVLLAGIMSSGDPNAGTEYTMRAITAVVVGGTSFVGGKGSLIGTFGGVLMLSIINNLLNLLGVDSYYQYVAYGLILIVALTISALKNKGE